jgi:hypothetical protein
VVVAIVSALAVASMGISASPAFGGDVPVGFERHQVQSAALSLLVPKGTRIAKTSGDALFLASDGGRYVKHAVSVLRTKYPSMPSRAVVRANIARLPLDEGDQVRVRRTSVADLPAILQTVTLGKTTTRGYFIEAPAGSVVFVSYTWPTAETDFERKVDTMVAGVRLLRD